MSRVSIALLSLALAGSSAIATLLWVGAAREPVGEKAQWAGHWSSILVRDAVLPAAAGEKQAGTSRLTRGPAGSVLAEFGVILEKAKSLGRAGGSEFAIGAPAAVRGVGTAEIRPMPQSDLWAVAGEIAAGGGDSRPFYAVINRVCESNVDRYCWQLVDVVTGENAGIENLDLSSALQAVARSADGHGAELESRDGAASRPSPDGPRWGSDDPAQPQPTLVREPAAELPRMPALVTGVAKARRDRSPSSGGPASASPAQEGSSVGTAVDADAIAVGDDPAAVRTAGSAPAQGRAPAGRSLVAAAVQTEEAEVEAVSAHDMGKTLQSARLPGRQADSPAPQTRKNAPVVSKLVWSIQTGLESLNMSPGPVDGLMGPKTRRAIEWYQITHQLPVDGRPSAELLAHIGLERQRRPYSRQRDDESLERRAPELPATFEMPWEREGPDR